MAREEVVCNLLVGIGDNLDGQEGNAHIALVGPGHQLG